jgi:hypothetical protein
MAARSKWSVAAVLILTATFIISCGTGTGSSESAVTPSVETAGENGGFEDLNLGEIQDLEFSDTGATLDFNGEAGGSDYLLIVNSTSKSTGDTTLQLARGTSSLSSDPVALALEDPEEDSGSQFHQFLREMEEVFSESEEFEEVSLSSLAALSAAPKVGETKPFRVLSTMGSITTYTEVNGKLRLASGDLHIYVDQTAEALVTDEDLEKLADDFEGIALPRERELFGDESDINFDGHISILMTCVLNRMATAGGIVTGFFFPGDLYQRSTANPASNAQEIFYTMVPDPKGDCGASPISKSFVIDNILPGVLAHEYQHMASFNQHLLRNGGPTEEPWLNECLAHLAEDLTGFGKENPSRAKLFLNQPAKTPIIPPTSPTLAERGGCYLFLRYLYEQAGDGKGFLQRLLNTRLTGVANLEAAFAGADPAFDQFPEFVNRWSVTLSLSETGLTSDPRYNYKARSIDPETANFTGVCIRCDAQDGRGTVLDGPVMTSVSSFPISSTLKATASEFYRLNAPSGTIRLNAGGTPELAGTLVRLEKN